jgi:hypothetical protein
MVTKDTYDNIIKISPDNKEAVTLSIYFLSDVMNFELEA